MLLRDRLASEGSLLFRWRSFVLPLLLIPALLALPESGAVEMRLGETLEAVWNGAGIAIAYLGCLLRVATVGFVPTGTSGRNTHGQRASTLNTTGLYSVVRNPLYLANALTVLGVAIEIKAAWLIVLVAAVLFAVYERIIMAEEAFLTREFGASYRAWAAVTPAIIPKPQLWRAPILPFSFRTVLRREYHGLYAVTVALVAIEFGNDVIGEGTPLLEWARADYPWVILAAVGTVLYIALRTVRRHTDWLRVEGR